MGRGRPKTEIQNPRKEEIFWEWQGREEKTMWPLWLDDIAYGVARLDWYGNKHNQIPLSTVNIIRCITTLDAITTESVMELLGLKKTQAKLYVKACSLCLPQIHRSLDNKQIKNMKYPSVTIVSYQHGLSLGYQYQERSKI